MGIYRPVTEPSGLLDTAAVARYFNVSSRTLYNWRKREKIRAYKVGGAYRYRPADIESCLENCQAQPRSTR